MTNDRPDAAVDMLTIASECDREGMRPTQVLRRLGLHGFAEVDLDSVVAEVDARVARLRGYFAEERRIKAALA